MYQYKFRIYLGGYHICFEMKTTEKTVPKKRI